MKKIMPLVLLIAVLAGGYWVYTSVLGGSLSGPTKTPKVPTERPDLPDPGDLANDGAEGAQDGANWLADFLTGLSPAAWKMIALAIVASFVYWLWKEPKRRALALVIVVIALLAVIVA